MNSLWAYFVCCCTSVLLRKPLENCLRAVRYGPHFVQSTKPQFSEVIALQESRRCTATESRRTTCEKARFPACGKCRPSRTAGKRFFRCPDEIWTPGLMPLPVPRFFEKNRVKLLILRTFLRNYNVGADSYVSAKLIFRQSESPLPSWQGAFAVSGRLIIRNTGTYPRSGSRPPAGRAPAPAASSPRTSSPAPPC